MSTPSGISTLDDGDRHEPLRGAEAVDQRVQDDARGGDDARLEAAARSIVAVELHIGGEEQHEGQDELGGDAQDNVETHVRLPYFLSPLAGGRPTA